MSHELQAYDIAGVGKFTYAARIQQAGTNRIPEGDIPKLLSIVPKGSICVDIGAHDGDSTIPLAIAVGPLGRVIAYEPNSPTYKVLTVNSVLPNPICGDISPFCLACSDKNGVATLYYVDEDRCNGGARTEDGFQWGAYEVIAKTVDTAAHLASVLGEDVSKISLIKIDTEGHELTILKNLESILLEHHPMILAEVFAHSKDRAAVANYMVSLGYSILDWNRGMAGAFPVKDLATLTTDFHQDILCVKR